MDDKIRSVWYQNTCGLYFRIQADYYSWTRWGPCDAECDGGISKRYRSPDNYVETRTCNPEPCTGKTSKL